MHSCARRRAVLMMGLFALLTASCAHPAVAIRDPSTAAAAEPEAPPTARSVPADPRVGAVFIGGDSLHACSAGVLDSANGDLILTAAHCLSDGTDATFVPGFNNDAAPEDYWHVDAVYLDPRWVRSQDPMADFAIARVSRAAGGTVEARAGGGLKLVAAPAPGSVVSVTGYAMGVGGGPIGCRVPTGRPRQGFPALPCAALVDGVSGAPWIEGSTVSGLIGGLDGGGCQDQSDSYSPPFDDAITALQKRAEAGGPADSAPVAFADGCR
ncbi:trypsin-like serine peptidase [Mycobacterium sp. URHB0021]